MWLGYQVTDYIEEDTVIRLTVFGLMLEPNNLSADENQGSKNSRSGFTQYATLF